MEEEVLQILVMQQGVDNNMKKKRCLVCNEEFIKNPKESKTQWANRKYCSYKCSNEVNPTKFKNGNPPPKTAYKKGEHPSEATQFKRGDLRITGMNNPNWKGGISQKNRGERMSPKMQWWRKDVFKRDNWTCFLCKKRGAKLVAHHILPFAVFSKYKFNVKNGVTLCSDCHKLTLKREWLYAPKFFGI